MSPDACARPLARWSLLTLVLLAACRQVEVSPAPPALAADPARVATRVQAVSEAFPEGFPNANERMIAVLTNLARHDPRTPNNNECGEFSADHGAGFPKKPLVYTETGNRAARFTSTHMEKQGCFQHESCCVLGKDGQGQVACVSNVGCTGDVCRRECSGGTSVAERYQLLGFLGYGAENIARGNSAYDVWCGWMESDGHRGNILGDATLLGVGVHNGGAAAACEGSYWTQAFGTATVTPPRIPVATAMHRTANPEHTGQLQWMANYYDPAGRDPLRATVVIDGRCEDVEQAYGVPGNGTFEKRYSQPDELAPGCHSYYFLFVDADAERHTYPATGSLQVAVGQGVTCPSDWVATQTPASCEQGPQECEAGTTRSCYSGPEGTAEIGECSSGVQSCRNGFWSSCVGEVLPRAETCNGLDDNCSGGVDDGNPGGGQSCSISSEHGVCRDGTRQCIAGALICVSDLQPSVEVCNGVDDDCDGIVDDGFPMITCGLGACFRTTSSCVNGQVVDSCTPGEPTEELADFKDNDCDGIVDNGFDCRTTTFPEGGQSRPCRSLPPTPEGGGTWAGPCATQGRQTCGADGAWSACEGESYPTQEICDGIDNDCDGTRDEDVDLGRERCGLGACRTDVASCRSGRPVSCEPFSSNPEICNGRDDSCNGTIDEGCQCQENFEMSCWTDRPSARMVGVCKDGIRTCRSGVFSACENQVLPSVEICGNELDEDCDGLADDGCDTSVPDAGEPDAGEPDAGISEPPPPPPGCGCSAGSMGSAMGMLALLGLIRRRR